MAMVKSKPDIVTLVACNLATFSQGMTKTVIDMGISYNGIMAVVSNRSVYN